MPSKAEVQAESIDFSDSMSSKMPSAAELAMQGAGTSDILERVGSEIHSSDKKTLDYEALLVAEALSTDAWKDALLNEWYGEELVDTWKRRPNYDAYRDRRIAELSHDEEGPEVLESIVQAHVREQLEKISHRRIYHNLTIGLELEVFAYKRQPDTVEQAHAIDSLTSIGIHVDKDALREIVLPYSHAGYEQLAAVQSLTKMDFIKPEQRVGVHLNVGGLVQFDENVLIVDQLMHAANLFNEPIVAGTILSAGVAKPLYDYDLEGGGFGLPFTIKTNANQKSDYSVNVIEFRGLPEIGLSQQHTKPDEHAHRSAPYQSYAKGVLDMEHLLEAVAGFQKVEYLDSNDKVDLELHKIWLDLKTQVIAEFESWGIASDRVATMRYTTGMKQSEEYYEHLADVRDKVANDGDLEENEVRRARMYSKVLKARKQINQLPDENV